MFSILVSKKLSIIELLLSQENIDLNQTDSIGHCTVSDFVKQSKNDYIIDLFKKYEEKRKLKNENQDLTKEIDDIKKTMN
jgi:hypothetical protein